MNKYTILLLTLISCDTRERITKILNQGGFNSFDNYALVARGESCILYTDSTNFYILPNDSIAPVLTMQADGCFKQGHLSNEQKLSVNKLFYFFKKGQFSELERFNKKMTVSLRASNQSVTFNYPDTENH